MPLSTSPTLPLLAAGYGILSVGFGINEIFRPLQAISFFACAPPEKEADKKLVQALSVALGVRNVFIGTAIFLNLSLAPANKPLLGWLVVAGSACAAADGLACATIVGDGGMNHAYAAGVLVLGGALLGIVG